MGRVVDCVVVDRVLVCVVVGVVNGVVVVTTIIKKFIGECI